MKLKRSIKLLRQLLLLLLHGVWAGPAVFAIRVLRPIKLIRVGVIQSSRIGHFAADPPSPPLVEDLLRNRILGNGRLP